MSTHWGVVRQPSLMVLYIMTDFMFSASLQHSDLSRTYPSADCPLLWQRWTSCRLLRFCTTVLQHCCEYYREWASNQAQGSVVISRQVIPFNNMSGCFVQAANVKCEPRLHYVQCCDMFIVCCR